MRITDIKEQSASRRRKNRVHIYLDDRFAFGLSKEAMVDFGLSCGQELSETEIEKILEQDQRVQAINKCWRWLGIRQRSEKEIETKLKENGFASQIIKKTVARVAELGYLNDREFARAWVETKKLGRPKGRLAMERDLKQKGVDQELIKKTIKKFYTEGEEKALALELAKKKIVSYGGQAREKQYQKMARFLLSRGFNWAIVKEVLDKIF